MGKDRGISKEIIVEALEAAMLTAPVKIRTECGNKAHYNDETGEVEVFQFKTVVEQGFASETQISKEKQGQRSMKERNPRQSRHENRTISSDDCRQLGKQIIIQRVKDAECDNIYDEYKDRRGELSTALSRDLKRSIVVNLGRAEGIVPPSEQIHREAYKRGERIRAYIFEVKKSPKGLQIILSRTHPSFLKALSRWRFRRFPKVD
jgi:N utilization substance protein A